jgi:5-formyltetrahydrofolate cyclo-ligase
MGGRSRSGAEATSAVGGPDDDGLRVRVPSPDGGLEVSAGLQVDDAGQPPCVAEAKAALRRRVREKRRSRDAGARAQVAEQLRGVVLGLPEVRGAATVACYVSRPAEPGTAPLLAALRDLGIRVLLPVLLADSDLAWEVATPGPAADRPCREALSRADVVLVPALAVDTLGHRLGQGGGSYDRALTRVGAGVPVVALVHDDEVLDAAVEPVPAVAHDRAVDLAATPSRVLRLRE